MMDEDNQAEDSMFDTMDEVPLGYKFFKEEVQAEREKYLKNHLLPAVVKVFEKYPALKSALLCCAQYWDDEANDAVHMKLIFSELDEPNFDGACYYNRGDDPNVPTVLFRERYSDEQKSSVMSDYDLMDVAYPDEEKYSASRIAWHDNSDAIPMWAAWTSEGGSQEFDRFQDVYTPAVLFRRDGTHEYKVPVRPWMDGIMPEWEG